MQVDYCSANKELFSSFNSSISLSFNLFFSVRLLTRNSNASLFSVSIFIFLLFSLILESTLLSVVDNFWMFLYSLFVFSTCLIKLLILSLHSCVITYLSFLSNANFKILTISFASFVSLHGKADCYLALFRLPWFFSSCSFVSK